MPPREKNFPQELPSNENSIYEEFLGTRKTETKANEYLFKVKGLKYSDSEWLTNDQVKSDKFLAFKVQKFSKQVPNHPPYYNPNFDIPQYILTKKDDKYLVKWKSLKIELSTWETEVPEQLIFNYEEIQGYAFEFNIPEKDPNSNTNSEEILSLSGYNELSQSNFFAFQAMASHLLSNYSYLIHCDKNLSLTYSILSWFKYNQEERQQPGPHLIVTQDSSYWIRQFIQYNYPYFECPSKEAYQLINDGVYTPAEMKDIYIIGHTETGFTKSQYKKVAK